MNMWAEGCGARGSQEIMSSLHYFLEDSVPDTSNLCFLSDCVSESIVVERGGRLVALVQPMENYIEWDKDSEDKIYEKIDTQKIRRFRY